eukprot:4718395-Prymnesium_polylepis.1
MPRHARDMPRHARDMAQHAPDMAQHPRDTPATPPRHLATSPRYLATCLRTHPEPWSVNPSIESVKCPTIPDTCSPRQSDNPTFRKCPTKAFPTRQSFRAMYRVR